MNSIRCVLRLRFSNWDDCGYKVTKWVRFEWSVDCFWYVVVVFWFSNPKINNEKKARFVVFGFPAHPNPMGNEPFSRKGLIGIERNPSTSVCERRTGRVKIVQLGVLYS